MTGLEGLNCRQRSWVETTSGSRKGAGRVDRTLTRRPAQPAFPHAASLARDRRRPGGPVWLERGLGVLRNGVLPVEAVNKGGHSQQQLRPLWPVSPEGVEAQGAGSGSRGARRVRASVRPGSGLPHTAAASCSTVNDSLGTPGIVARQALRPWDSGKITGVVSFSSFPSPGSFLTRG